VGFDGFVGVGVLSSGLVFGLWAAVAVSSELSVTAQNVQHAGNGTPTQASPSAPHPIPPSPKTIPHNPPQPPTPNKPKPPTPTPTPFHLVLEVLFELPTDGVPHLGGWGWRVGGWGLELGFGVWLRGGERAGM
jgi:hypothetical protein